MMEKNKKGGKEKLQRKVVMCTALIALVVSMIVMPAAQAKPIPVEEAIKARMEHGFRNYLKRLGVRESSIDNQTASALFKRFLQDNPEYQEDLRQYDIIKNQKKKPKATPDFSRCKISLGSVIKSFNITINGSEYLVEVREAYYQNGSDLVKVYKATFFGPEGLVDPWIYVHIDYLGFWFLWWYVTYGEDQWFYTHYTTNANGINEAALLKARVEEWAIGTTAISGIVSIILACFTGPIAGIVGIVGTYNAAWTKHVIDNAYDSSRGIKICWFNHYLYTQIGSAIALWAWWWSDSAWHRALPAYGLEWAYLAVSAFTAWAISSMIHGVGDKYGYDKWVWAGVYR